MNLASPTSDIKEIKMDNTSNFKEGAATNHQQTSHIEKEERLQDWGDLSSIKSPRVLLHRIEDFVKTETPKVRQTFPPLLPEKSLQKDAISAKFKKIKSEGYVKVSLFNDGNKTKTDKKRELLKVHKISNPTKHFSSCKNNFNVKNTTSKKKDKTVSDSKLTSGIRGETLEKGGRHSPSGSNSSLFALSHCDNGFSNKTMAYGISKESLFVSQSESTTVLPRLANLTPGKCKSYTRALSPDKRVPYTGFMSPPTNFYKDQSIDHNNMYKPIVYPNSCQITPKVCLPRQTQSSDSETNDIIPRTKLSGWNLCYPVTEASANMSNNVTTPSVFQSQSILNRNTSTLNVIESRTSILRTGSQVDINSNVFSQKTERSKSIFHNHKGHHYNSQLDFNKLDVTHPQYSQNCSTSYKQNHTKRSRPCSTNVFYSYNDGQTSLWNSDEQKTVVPKNDIKGSDSVSSACNDKIVPPGIVKDETQFLQEFTQSNRRKCGGICPINSTATSTNSVSHNYLSVTAANLDQRHSIPSFSNTTTTSQDIRNVDKREAISESINKTITPYDSQQVTPVGDSDCTMCHNQKELSGLTEEEIAQSSAKPVVAWMDGQNAFIVHLPRCEISEESLPENETQVDANIATSWIDNDKMRSSDEDIKENIENDNVSQILLHTEPFNVELSKIQSIFSDTLVSTEKSVSTSVSKTKSRKALSYQSAEISMPMVGLEEAAKKTFPPNVAKFAHSVHKLVAKNQNDNLQTSYRLSKNDNSKKVVKHNYSVKKNEERKYALLEKNENRKSQIVSNQEIYKSDGGTQWGEQQEASKYTKVEEVTHKTVSATDSKRFRKDSNEDESIYADAMAPNTSARKTENHICSNDTKKLKQQTQQNSFEATFSKQHHEGYFTVAAPAFMTNSIPLPAVSVNNNTSRNMANPNTTSVPRRCIINTGDRYVVSALPVNTFSANAGSTYLVNPLPVTLSINGTNNYNFKQTHSSLSSRDRVLPPTGINTLGSMTYNAALRGNESNIITTNNAEASTGASSGESKKDNTTHTCSIPAATDQKTPIGNCNVSLLSDELILPHNLDKNLIMLIQQNQQLAETKSTITGASINVNPAISSSANNENHLQMVKGKGAVSSLSFGKISLQNPSSDDQRKCVFPVNENTSSNIQIKNHSLLSSGISQNSHSTVVDTAAKYLFDSTSANAIVNDHVETQVSGSTGVNKVATTPRKVTQIKVVLPSMFSPGKQTKQKNKNRLEQTDSGVRNNIPDRKKLNNPVLSNKNNFNVNAKDCEPGLSPSSKIHPFFKKLELKKVTQEPTVATSPNDKETHRFKFKRYALCVSVHLSAVGGEHAYSAVTIVTDPANSMFSEITHQTDLFVYIVYDEQKTIMFRSILSKYPLNPGLYSIEHTSTVKNVNNVVFEGAVLKPCPHLTTVLQSIEHPLIAIGNIRIKWADACTDLVNQISTPISKVAIERVLAESNASARRPSEFLKAMADTAIPSSDSSNRGRNMKRKREALDCRCLECRKLGTFIEYKISKMLKSKSPTSNTNITGRRMQRPLVSRQLKSRKNDLTFRSHSVNTFANSKYTFSSTHRRGLFPRHIRSGPIIVGESSETRTRSKLSNKWRPKSGFRRSTRRLVINKKYCTNCDGGSHGEDSTGFDRNSNNMYNFRYPGQPTQRSRRVKRT